MRRIPADRTTVEHQREGSRFEQDKPGKVRHEPMADAVLTLQRTVGNQALQNIIQRARGGGKKKKKNRKGGRSTNRKFGKINMRDQKPGMMSHPRFGKIFTDFWHNLKQKSNNQMADYSGDKMLYMTLADLAGGNTNMKNADKTLYEVFSDYLKKRHRALYDELIMEAEIWEQNHIQPNYMDMDFDDDDDYSDTGHGNNQITIN